MSNISCMSEYCEEMYIFMWRLSGNKQRIGFQSENLRQMFVLLSKLRRKLKLMRTLLYFTLLYFPLSVKWFSVGIQTQIRIKLRNKPRLTIQWIKIN